MIFDKELMLAERMPMDQTGPVIDLKQFTTPPPFADDVGTGNVLIVHVQGEGFSITDPNEPGTKIIIVLEGSDNGVDAWYDEMRVSVGPITIRAGGIAFGLSSAVTRFIRLKMHTENINSGLVTAGIVMNSLIS